MAASFCKVASNLDSHPKIRRAGSKGREVFLFALRRNAEPDHPTPGRVHRDFLSDSYLADQLMVTAGDARDGRDAAVTAGLLAVEGEHFVICGWEESWGRTAKGGKERTAKWRESKKAKDAVTNGDGRDVTESHGDARDVREEKRREEIIPSESSEGKAKGKRKGPTIPLPADWAPTSEHTAIASERGVDVAIEARRFRLHAEANDRRAVRWNAAFSQWLLKATPDRAGGYQAPPAGGFAPPRLL